MGCFCEDFTESRSRNMLCGRQEFDWLAEPLAEAIGKIVHSTGLAAPECPARETGTRSLLKWLAQDPLGPEHWENYVLTLSLKLPKSARVIGMYVRESAGVTREVIRGLRPQTTVVCSFRHLILWDVTVRGSTHPRASNN